MTKVDVKAAALESLRRLYPEGVGNRQQHKDIILVYLSGWCDCLKAHGQIAALAALLPEVERMAHPGWWPDEGWAWWSTIIIA